MKSVKFSYFRRGKIVSHSKVTSRPKLAYLNSKVLALMLLVRPKAVGTVVQNRSWIVILELGNNNLHQRQCVLEAVTIH